MNRNKPLRLIDLSKTETKTETECDTKPKLTLNRLSRIPIQCPLETCPATICKQDLLYHLTSQHLRSHVRKHLQLAFDGERCTLVFDPSQLLAMQTICLGVLLYGGERGGQEPLPGAREFSHRNRLPRHSELEPLQDYLPVMVLVRKTGFLDWVLPDRNVESDEDTHGCAKSRVEWVRHLDFTSDTYPKFSKNLHRARNSEKFCDLKQRDISEHERADLRNLDMYTIWTQSAPCIRPLRVCMTVFNRSLSDGRSALGWVANSGRVYPEIGGKQLPKDRHSMWLTQQELQEMCGAEYHLQLEVILNVSVE
ncbi:uncharacterized protein LOC6550983 [Drosophila erecta]|uniref:DUF4729 domain-containing protein n=1 Tax=Drosophila erecta TaxID=7220 RepID=B3NU67_DROER|nr:uncharacterized protein LOC6550983 [Drosophila erecta]EDV45843.1 uncharacterized protein Dere_GG18518 [Drosophila erecta]